MQEDDSSLSEDEYYVEQVLDKKIENGETLYKIKWSGWSVENSTWEPLKNLENIKNLIEDFEKQRREKIKKESVKSSRIAKEKSKKTEYPSTLSNDFTKNSSSNKMNNEKIESEKTEVSVITDLGYNTPEEVISVKKDQEGNILCYVKFKERSDGILPSSQYVTSLEMREKHPKLLISYYESKIKFVDKK